MLKQGMVQETLADLNGSTTGALPPLHNLPHWSRVNNFDKARYPKPFLKDRLQPLPNPSEMDPATAVGIQTGMAMEPEDDVQVDISRGLNSNQRILHLEKSIHFLQQQHHEVLSSLHEEIDELKRENKDLHFRVVMMQKSPQSPGSAHSKRAIPQADRPPSHKDHSKSQGIGSFRVPHPPSVPKPGALNDELRDSPNADKQSQGSEEKIEELKIIFLEEEIKDLKKALKDERSRSHYLQQLVDNRDRSGQLAPSVQPHHELKAHSAGPRGPSQQPESPTGRRDPTEPPAPIQAYHTPPPENQAVPEPLPYNATLNPLRVTVGHAPARTPTSKECEVIIKHLQRISDNQAHELNQLKSDLRDVLYSHKWTPDAFLLAKAYVAEDDAREMAEQNRLPKIELKHSTRKLPDIAYIQKDALSLPALKHRMGNKAIERKKRNQILQKGRIGKEMAN